jgi:hypothetical protein
VVDAEAGVASMSVKRARLTAGFAAFALLLAMTWPYLAHAAGA